MRSIGWLPAAALAALAFAPPAAAGWLETGSGHAVHVDPAGPAASATPPDRYTLASGQTIVWDESCKTWRDLASGKEFHVDPAGPGGAPHEADHFTYPGGKSVFWTPSPCAPPPPQAARPPTALETGVLDEINQARADPPAYAGRLRPAPYVDVSEAAAFLRGQAPVPRLTYDGRLAATAVAQQADQGPRGGASDRASDGSRPSERMRAAGVETSAYAEAISISYSAPRAIVQQLIVDQPGPQRPLRADLFDPSLVVAGVGCGPNTKYGTMCVIDFASRYAAAPPPPLGDAICGGPFFDAARQPLAQPREPHSRAPDAELRAWRDKVVAFYAAAYDASGARLGPDQAARCVGWRIEKEIRADDSVASGLTALLHEGAGPR
ncbi:MAG TPA: CAP domain-containing protein [Caulobacteraceae bacterium]|nr:CAP domain-containing protein [Caulobacteraceae bacterium]